MQLYFLGECAQGLTVMDGIPLIRFKRNITIKPFKSIKEGGFKLC